MTIHLVELNEVGSTNDWMMEHADELPSGSWVTAGVQTAGRGRRGQAWRSSPGNLYASTVIHLEAADPPATQLTFVAAVALADTLAAWVSEERLKIKWPNDLLLDNRKLAGILLERRGAFLITGFGVNLAGHPHDLERPAISLAGAEIHPPAPGDFVRRLSDSHAAWLECWRTTGFEAIRSEWLRRAHPFDTVLVARLTDGSEITGKFDGLAGDGALLLRLADGARRVIHVADVFAL